MLNNCTLSILCHSFSLLNDTAKAKPSQITFSEFYFFEYLYKTRYRTIPIYPIVILLARISSDSFLFLTIFILIQCIFFSYICQKYRLKVLKSNLWNLIVFIFKTLIFPSLLLALTGDITIIYPVGFLKNISLSICVESICKLSKYN